MSERNEDNPDNKAQANPPPDDARAVEADALRVKARQDVDFNRQKVRGEALNRLALVEQNASLIKAKLMSPDLKDEDLMNLHDSIVDQLEALQKMNQ